MNYLSYIEFSTGRGEGRTQLVDWTFGGAKGLEALTKAAGEWVTYDGKAIGDLNIVIPSSHSLVRAYYKSMEKNWESFSAELTVLKAEKIHKRFVATTVATYIFEDVLFTTLKSGQTSGKVAFPVELVSFTFTDSKASVAKGK